MASISRSARLGPTTTTPQEAITFYSKLFNTEPAKIKPGYANFAITEPPLKPVLLQNPGHGGTLNHLGQAAARSEVERLRRVRLPGRELPGLPQQRLRLGVPVERLLDLAVLAPVLGAGEEHQLVRRLAADESGQHRDVLGALLRDHILDAFEQLLQVVPHLGLARLDRYRSQNRHSLIPFHRVPRENRCGMVGGYLATASLAAHRRRRL